MPPDPWWRGGVLYQIYPRSFADSDGDGTGDLRGILDRLEYLEWLGIDGIWLNPTMPSPNADWGYDVADYCAVHPDLGTLDDLDRLVREAEARGISVLLDLVPNHTSDRHTWFAGSRSSRESRRRDWYVWADGRPDGAPPTQWQSAFGGSAWTLDERTGQHYLHSFLPEQPELNWWNDAVRREFERILRFWFDRGIAGFRIDVVHRLVKDRELRDKPPDADDPYPPADVPEVHAVLRRWRVLADECEPSRVLLGETWVLDLEELAAFYGGGEDELHLAFNFAFLLATFDAQTLRAAVERWEQLLPPAAWPVWTLSNHDVVRFPTRWCEGRDERVRCALMVLLTLRGTPVLYYGDEIGMPQLDVPAERTRDMAGRDGARTPMQWSAGSGAGFTDSDEPWLPLGDYRTRSVDRQREDPASILVLCRDLVRLRRETAELRSGSYASLEAPPGAWAWRRGESVVVAVNLTDSETSVAGVDGTIRLCTDRARDGAEVSGSLRLPPWQGAVVSA